MVAKPVTNWCVGALLLWFWPWVILPGYFDARLFDLVEKMGVILTAQHENIKWNSLLLSFMNEWVITFIISIFEFWFSFHTLNLPHYHLPCLNLPCSWELYTVIQQYSFTLVKYEEGWFSMWVQVEFCKYMDH